MSEPSKMRKDCCASATRSKMTATPLLPKLSNPYASWATGSGVACSDWQTSSFESRIRKGSEHVPSVQAPPPSHALHLHLRAHPQCHTPRTPPPISSAMAISRQRSFFASAFLGGCSSVAISIRHRAGEGQCHHRHVHGDAGSWHGDAAQHDQHI